jgi:hypothetical protein
MNGKEKYLDPTLVSPLTLIIPIYLIPLVPFLMGSWRTD